MNQSEKSSPSWRSGSDSNRNVTLTSVLKITCVIFSFLIITVSASASTLTDQKCQFNAFFSASKSYKSDPLHKSAVALARGNLSPQQKRQHEKIFTTEGAALVRAIVFKMLKGKETSTLREYLDAGMEGLAISLKKFSPDLGFRFDTYADDWIRMKIRRQIGFQTNPLLSQHVQHLLLTFDSVHKIIEEVIGPKTHTETVEILSSEERVAELKLLVVEKKPDDAEAIHKWIDRIAVISGGSPGGRKRRIEWLKKFAIYRESHGVARLDKGAFELTDETNQTVDEMKGFRERLDQFRETELKNWMDPESPREARDFEILKAIYFEGAAANEFAEKFKVSRQRVQQIAHAQGAKLIGYIETYLEATNVPIDEVEFLSKICDYVRKRMGKAPKVSKSKPEPSAHTPSKAP